MNYPNGIPPRQNSESAEMQAAKISLIGAALSTLGDGLQTIAAGITLQELENQTFQNQNSPEQPNQTAQLELMQKQIDHLTRKIESMERRNK